MWTIRGVTIERSKADAPRDRRVRRSRSALMSAAVDLVSERGTANVSVTDIAEAADVSRQVLYQHFGDRDTLLVEATLELIRVELLPNMGDLSGQLGVDRPRMLTAVRHFAEHRVFYRALLNSSAGYVLDMALQQIFRPLFREAFEHQFDGRLDANVIEDLSAFVAGGIAPLRYGWLMESDGPLDPEEFTDRLMRLIELLGQAPTDS